MATRASRPECLEVLEQGGDIGAVILEGIRPGRAEDCAASGDDAVGLLDYRGLRLMPRDESSPAFEDADAGAALIGDALDDGTDHRVQAGAVATTGQ